MLRPQDVLVACKLLVIGRVDWTFASLAESVGMASSAVYVSVTRSRISGLLSPSGDRVCRPRLASLLTTSVPDVFFAQRGAIVAGVPTSTSAPCLAESFPVPGRQVAQVWPFPGARSPVTGESLLPIYQSVPLACQRDERLYRVMALLDVVRVGNAAEKKIAIDCLRKIVLADGSGADGGKA